MKSGDKFLLELRLRQLQEAKEHALKRQQLLEYLLKGGRPNEPNSH